MKMGESKISVAGKTISIKTNTKKLNEVIKIYLPEFGSKRKTDLELEYFFYEDISSSCSLSWNKWEYSKELKWNEKKRIAFFKDNQGKKKIISGKLDLNKGKGKIKFRIKREVFWRAFILNLLKCLAIYFNKNNASIIHSSSISRKGKVLLFPGKSETGKSTIALLHKGTALGQDRNIIFKKGKKFFVQAFPFTELAANISKNKSKKTELKAVLFLNQAKKLKLKKLNKIQAIQKLLKNDVHGNFNFQKIRAVERLAFYTELFSEIPAFSLFFPLNKNLAEKIEKKMEKQLLK